MLEILLLVFLCKRLGAMLREKGRSAGWMQFLLVICWFGGELVCGVAIVVFMQMAGSQEPGIGAYFGALLGAAGGATIVFIIAHNLAPLNQQRPFSAFPVMHPGSGYGPGPSSSPPPPPGPPIRS
jgi:hypothetical protein